MKKETKKVLALILASMVFFVFFSLPIVSKYVNNQTNIVKLAKDPDDSKLFPLSPYKELLKKGAVPKSLIAESKKKPHFLIVLYRQLASFCAPVANIAGAISPAISISWAVAIWIRSRKKKGN